MTSPGSIDKVASLGATVTEPGPLVRPVPGPLLRSPRPLIEDNSQRSKATTLTYLRVGYKIAPNVRVAVDAFNLFDRKASDIDYDDASRLNGEPADGINDIHFHPVEPRRLRVTVTASF